jgi:hypothetical protein
LRLTYYDWRTLENGEEPVFIVFQGEGHLWSPTHTVAKVNAHSKYVWFVSMFTDVFTVGTHELREG